MAGQVSSDPLFVGLTRPTMIFGVSIQYAMLNLMISVTTFIQQPSIYVIFIAAIVHLVGYLLCFKEPRFLELYLNYARKCNQCSNKSYYGANSYNV
ncbi:MAG TPA: VirB3 family type IV secretion system protein [Candidatus Megaira endosymbiont of Nemacystus decipiens]|nr:VirB3 family type IV secretion system protein [Candidatus Megaera endosymbiont of Nemacystus decipiens]